MFQLFKKRNFSALVGDTFDFFKIQGKHYFRNYFIVNGGFLLVLLVLIYFIVKIVFEGIMANASSGYAEPNAIDAFMNENLPLIIGLSIFTGIVALFLTLLSYAFPVAYLDLLQKKNDFSTKEIIDVIKSKLGKIVIFFIASIFILIPLMMIAVLLSFALVFILIGIPLIFIVIPAMVSWFSLSFYDYISTDSSYFDALGNGFNLLKQKFWPVVGSTAVMYVIMQITVSVVSMIPYFIGIASMFTTLDNTPGTPDSETLTFFMIMLVITMVVSILLNFILQNLLLVNQGIIYYSLREENENNTPKSEMDLIGTHSE